jgi:hypothetical protein
LVPSFSRWVQHRKGTHKTDLINTVSAGAVTGRTGTWPPNTVYATYQQY